jgi:hypothetical protein
MRAFPKLNYVVPLIVNDGVLNAHATFIEDLLLRPGDILSFRQI